jgi:putative ABC transport system permease protein
MNRCLQNFAYRIDINPWMFFLAASLTFVISLLTVSFQAVRAAVSNPVKALRYE